MGSGIKQHHLAICGGNTLHWIFWYIDLENMLKCYSKKMYQNIWKALLNDGDRLFVCKNAVNVGEDEWNAVIDDLVNILELLRAEQGDGAPQIELAEFIEKMLYFIFDDVMFIPIFVSLQK